MSHEKGEYLLSIEPILGTSDHDDANFLAYFVGSTAPNNVEDGVSQVPNPERQLRAIAKFLADQPDDREILIVVHGYNTSLGSFSRSANGEANPNPSGVKGWYESIKNHIAEHYFSKSLKTTSASEMIKPKGLVLLGYRWSSEVINGIENDSLKSKFNYAAQSLPALLKLLLIVGALGFLISVAAILITPYNALVIEIASLLVLILTLATASIVLALLLLRLSGYFRDSYRANNYGVPDLVELIRQLDNFIVDESPGFAAEDNPIAKRAAKENYWQEKTTKRIKLSFIGHSMGGFVVTNTLRILSDVFDQGSIGNFNTENKSKAPSSEIGHVFSLGRLVLVAPDIPAESIISGRANFLSSSLRRFEEAYLFSNEGDMALRLASTAANYFNFPAKTQAGGYRLGNVTVSKDRYKPEQPPDQATLKTTPDQKVVSFGVVNLDQQGELIGAKPRKTNEGDRGIETAKVDIKISSPQASKTVQVSSFLNYLFILPGQPLSRRQSELLYSDRKPIAELFTFFDCTDYQEVYPQRREGKPKKMGVLTHVLEKEFLNFFDHSSLAIDFLSGKIDTHGGYFNDGDARSLQKVNKPWTKPEARVSKQLIYGLACLGFQNLLLSVAHDYSDVAAELSAPQDIATLGAIASTVDHRKQALLAFSKLCKARGIQVLLAPERYNRDILNIWTEDDRIGY